MIGSLTGVLLAGGLSTRMGATKALLDLDGSSFLARIARALAPVCPDLVLSVGTKDDAPDDVVEELRAEVASASPKSVAVVRDALPRQGPVGGLAPALARVTTEWAFVTGCDSPFLATSLVEGLSAAASDDADVLLPVWEGRPEPLLALYRAPTMAAHYARQLEAGGGSPVARLDEVRVERIDEARLRTFDPDGASFLNVNDRAAYERARARLAGS